MKKTFPHGNYPAYYGYRLGDNRVDLIDQTLIVAGLDEGLKGMVEGKRCLDIGCNSGSFTIDVAFQFSPSWILGVDIDPDLIHKARRNVFETSKELNIPADEAEDGGVRYPLVSLGPLIPKFPWCIRFSCQDFLQSEHYGYDVVFCMSVTKWIHLNGGDAAILRLFSRIQKALRPGGILILEPQPFSSYARRKDLSAVRPIYQYTVYIVIR